MNFIQSSRNATMKWHGKDQLIITVKLETGAFTQFLISFQDSVPVMRELDNSFKLDDITADEVKFKFFEAMSKYSWLKMEDFEMFRNIYINLKHEEIEKSKPTIKQNDSICDWLKTSSNQDVDNVSSYSIEQKEVTSDESNSNEE